MGGAGDNAEQPSGQRSVIGDVAGMLTQELRRQAHHVVKSAGGLQRCCRCDHRHNDEHDVDGQAARFQTEDEHKDEDTDHAVDAEADTAHTSTYEYQRQYDGQLEKDDCCCHRLVEYRLFGCRKDSATYSNLIYKKPN